MKPSLRNPIEGGSMATDLDLQYVDELRSPPGVFYHYIWFTGSEPAPHSVKIEVPNVARNVTLAANRGRQGAELVAARYPEGPPAEKWSVSLEGGLEQHDTGTRLDD
jgi:hypothetical protein